MKKSRENSAAKTMMNTFVYFGTYTRGGESRGIYQARFNPDTGALSDPLPAARAANPTFLAIHPTTSMLYAVDAADASGEARCGAVSAFAIDRDSGGLTPRGQSATRSRPPCHITVDATGRHLLFASYHDGCAGVLALDAHGVPGRLTAHVQHEGFGPHPERQTQAHAHSITLSPDQRFAFAADLGMDRLMTYRFDAAAGTLTPHRPAAVAVPPGAGPRHFTFHPHAPFAYLINELDSTIMVFAYDAAAGHLEPVQIVPALPPGFDGENTAAEIAVHPVGTFLYGSNRGHDSLVRYALDPHSGRLSTPAWTASGGQGPRHFAIHPAGRFLLTANQSSGTVVVMQLDPATGALTPIGKVADVPQVVCVRFA